MATSPSPQHLFTNPHIQQGMARGGLIVSPPPPGSKPRITARQAADIVNSDPARIDGGVAPPVQVVLVEMTHRLVSQSPPSFPSGYPTAFPAGSTLPDSRFDASPCLCWVVDLTLSQQLRDPIHNRYVVSYVIAVVDAQTGLMRDDEEG